MNKSTVEEIKERFDHDVERFSNIDTGQVSTIDAQVSLELITEAANRICPKATQLLDVGCGAGNYTLKMLSKNSGLNCTLVDLSMPMLDRAVSRVASKTTGEVKPLQGDIRNVLLPKGGFDIILAGAVFHHLRDDDDWECTFLKLYELLKPGGCLMISDLITQETPELTAYTWEKYGEYLERVGGKDYARNVFANIEKEDTPRSLTYQLELMQRIGFRKTEILHKNMSFAAFGGIK